MIKFLCQVALAVELTSAVQIKDSQNKNDLELVQSWADNIDVGEEQYMQTMEDSQYKAPPNPDGTPQYEWWCNKSGSTIIAYWKHKKPTPLCRVSEYGKPWGKWIACSRICGNGNMKGKCSRVWAQLKC